MAVPRDMEEDRGPLLVIRGLAATVPGDTNEDGDPLSGAPDAGLGPSGETPGGRASSRRTSASISPSWPRGGVARARGLPPPPDARETEGRKRDCTAGRARTWAVSSRDRRLGGVPELALALAAEAGRKADPVSDPAEENCPVEGVWRAGENRTRLAV